MINNTNKKTLLYISISLFFILAIISCGKNPKKPQPNDDKNKHPVLPEIFLEMEAHILKMMYDIDCIEGVGKFISDEKANTSDKPPSETNLQLKTGDESKTKINMEPQDDEEDKPSVKIEKYIEEKQLILSLLKEEKVEGSKTMTTKIPDNVDEIWFESDKRSYDLYKMWNVLEAKLHNLTASKDAREELKKKLDLISDSIGEKNVRDSLFSLNSLTMDLSTFVDSFDSKVPKSVFRMKYHTRQAVLDASEQNYKQAISHLNMISELKSSPSQKLIEQEDKNIVDKLNFSIDDLKKQLEAGDFHLIQVKAAIVIKNIMLMENVLRGSVD